MKFIQNYVSKVVGVAALGIAGIIGYMGIKDAPLESGYYEGNVDGKPAVLHVDDKGGNIRDCLVTIGISSGKNGRQTLYDGSCDNKNLYFDSKGLGSKFTVRDLTDISRQSKEWVSPDNEITFEKSKAYLDQN